MLNTAFKKLLILRISNALSMNKSYNNVLVDVIHHVADAEVCDSVPGTSTV